MRRCSKCILPETYPGIQFDADGVCNICHSYKKPSLKSEQELLYILDKYRKKQGYDCIVPISGGRESCYVLYIIKKKYKMNPIAVSYDNEFVSKQAKKNMENAVKILNVPLVIKSSRKKLRQKIVSDSVKLALFYGVEYVVSALCSHCWLGMETAVHRVAKKNNISLIIWGDSFDEEAQVELPKQKSVSPYYSKIKILFSPLIFNYLRLHFNAYRFRAEFSDGPNSPHPRFSPGLHIFDYINHDENEIIKTITTHLNWSKPKDYKFPWRFDCLLARLITYIMRKRYGFSKVDITLSKMIRKGLITREEALKFVTVEDEEEFSKLIPILKKLKLSEKEIEKIHNIKPIYESSSSN